jgi:hypothetical protein
MMGGWEGYDPAPGYEDREMAIPYADTVVRRGDIPKIMRDYKTVKQVTLFFDCEAMGQLPYAGGLYEQPWYIVEIFRTLKAESAKRKQRGG